MYFDPLSSNDDLVKSKSESLICVMCFRKAKYHWSIDCQSTKEKCKYVVIYNQSLLAIFQLDGFNCKNIHGTHNTTCVVQE